MESDEDLYLRVRKGDLGAFDQLYERHRSALFRFIYGYLKNKEDSEEVFHEAFMKVLGDSQVDFRQGTFRGWTYTVARNMALNRLRSHRTQRDFVQTIEYQPPHVFGDNDLIQQDFAQKVLSVAQTLPEPMYEVFRLRKTGMAYQEISQALDIPIGTVKSRLHKLIEILKVRLKLND